MDTYPLRTLLEGFFFPFNHFSCTQKNLKFSLCPSVKKEKTIFLLYVTHLPPFFSIDVDIRTLFYFTDFNIQYHIYLKKNLITDVDIRYIICFFSLQMSTSDISFYFFLITDIDIQLTYV